MLCNVLCHSMTANACTYDLVFVRLSCTGLMQCLVYMCNLSCSLCACCLQYCTLSMPLSPHPDPTGALLSVAYMKLHAKHVTLCLSACRAAILICQIGCSTASLMPGSLPVRATWPTSRSSYRSSSTCQSS